MPVLMLVLSLLLFFSGCQNNTTAPAALSPLPMTAPGAQTASLGLNIYWPVSQSFDLKAIPANAEELQVEIVEAGSYQNLYRTTITRSEVQQDRVNKQIRIDMQGSQQKDVTVSVAVRDRLKAVIASARQSLILKAGEINRVLLKVQVNQNNVTIIGGGGGGGGGGGTPIPTPTPTTAPTTYTITPQFNTFYVDVNQPFSLSFKIWNGTEPGYIWQFAGTNGLPTGLSFTSSAGGNVAGSPPPLLGLLTIPSDTVTLQGTTSQVGTFPFTITVLNGSQTTQRTYNLVVRSLEVFPATVKPATAGVSYNQAFQALYGAPPYTWSSSGNLPPGLTLNTNNTETIRLSGTPTSAINTDSYTFKIKVTDSLNRSAEQTYVLGCGSGALASFRNAQPIVDSVSPRQGGNHAEQTLTISGSNFLADSTVFLDKIPLQIQSRSGTTQIVATVPAGVKPGTYNLLVINPNSSIGRIEGGLANGYTVQDSGGLNSSVPTIGALFLRNQPILPTTTQEELVTQLLTLTTSGGSTELIPGKALNQNTLDFVPILISGANFTPNSLVYLSELILPGFYVDSTQILTIVPLKLLFPDIPGVPQFTGYNKLVVVNPNLESSNPEQGKFAVSGSFDAAEGPGVGYISYVYPQKGFDSETNRVVVKGCGFERPHTLNLGGTPITQKIVELPSVIRMAIEPGKVFPNVNPYDLRLFRVESLAPVLSDNATGVFTMLARERKVTACSPNAVLPNLTMAITLSGSGFEAGTSTKFIRHNGGIATGTEYISPVGAPKTSMLSVALVPGSMPQGEYKVQMTWPGGFTYTTPDTCLRVEAQAAQPAPTISSVSPTAISNNILNPEDVVDIVIEGNHFQSGAAIYIGAKQALSGTGTTTRLTINSDSVYAMKPGTYPIRVVNPDGQTVTATTQLTVTDGGAELAGAPEIIQVVPSNPYRSMLNPYPDAGYIYFQASNILPGSYVQVVSDPNSPFDPQDGFLDNIVILDPGSGSVRGTLPFLRAGSYYLRLVNADGQMDTAETPIIFENSAPPEIETDLTQLTGAPDCKQPVCPASWPNNTPVVLTINGKNFGVQPNFSGVQLVSTADPNSVITLQNVTSYNTSIPMVIAGLPDGLAPGDYWVRVINPDGQTSDAVNKYDPDTGKDTRVKFTILSSSTRWSRAQRMPNLADPGALPALHGRAGASSVVDPDTGKIYFFGGNDARKDYNHLTRTLISYSETSAWQDLSNNVPLTLNVRTNHAAAWKNGSSASDDRMFIFGGTTWSCASAPPGTCPSAISPSFLDDLWMYNPNDNSWTAITLSGSGRIPLSNAKMHWNPGDNSLYIYGGATTTGNGVLGSQYNNKIFKLTVNFSNNTAVWSTVTPTNAGPTSSAPDCFTADANRPCAWIYNELLSDPERARFFIFGGSKVFTGSPLNDKFWMFDIAKNKWAEISQSGVSFTGRMNLAHGFDFNNQKLYVFGGNQGYATVGGITTATGLTSQMNLGSFSNWSGDADNPPAIAWSEELATPILPRYSHACAWSNGRFYVFGGLNQDGVRLYDPNSPIDPLVPGHTYYTDIWQYIP